MIGYFNYTNGKIIDILFDNTEIGISSDINLYLISNEFKQKLLEIQDLVYRNKVLLRSNTFDNGVINDGWILEKIEVTES